MDCRACENYKPQCDDGSACKIEICPYDTKSCPNCGQSSYMVKNSSDQWRCNSCGWEEGIEQEVA